MKRICTALLLALWLAGCATTAPSVTPAAPAAQPQASVAVGPYAADRVVMVPVEGGRVYVRINGNLENGKPPVVFIHGGPGGTHAGFVRVLPLADERAVILYDQLDTGASDRPGDRALWNVPRFTAELEAIRKYLGLARWHVVGHSWGGTLALEYGAAHGEHAASITLSSPLISTRSWIADADHWRSQLPAETQRDLTACESPQPPGKDVCNAAEREFYSRHMSRQPRRTGLPAYQPPGRGNSEMYLGMWGPSEFTATGTLRDYDGEPLLAQLPGERTLFMTGQWDEARPETITAYSRQVQGAELAIIPGAGHGVLSDRPEEVLALLRLFLRRHDAPPAGTP